MHDDLQPPEAEYDYIVVGSGAGGGPLAANLAGVGLAKKGYKVALLEAGGADTTCDYQVPAFFTKVSEDPLLRWDYVVQHYDDVVQQGRDKKKLLDKDGRVGIWYPRAGTLGGCTAHNALITICPHAFDWDDIAKLTGDTSWGASEMRKYFSRIERCGYLREPNFGRPHPGGHGFTGWLSTVAAPPSLLVRDWKIFRIVVATLWSTLEGKLWPSLRLLWHSWRKFDGGPIAFLRSFFDPNDTRTPCTEREGVFIVPFATSSGRRVSVRDLIDLASQDHPENLRVYSHSLATRVLFERSSPDPAADPVAIGVEFMQGLNLYRADPTSARNAPEPPRRWLKARQEVILAAGTFNTPQLLKLSGIGPRCELEKHGICVLLDRPGVGANLQDRYEISVVTKTKSDFALTRGSTFSFPSIGQYPDPLFAKWLKGRGPYATNGIVIALTKKSRPTQRDTDVFIFCVPGVFKGYFHGYSDHLAKDKSFFSWVILKSHTSNRTGSVTLRSTDPRDVPQISFRYFPREDDGADLEAVLGGVKAVRRINSKLASFIEQEIVPGPQVSDDEAIRNHIQDQAWGHHAAGTAAMGRPDDQQAVVDSCFKVIGTKRLRIVDASVFPRISGFFIVTSIYMIAEKAAEVIRRDAPPCERA